MTENRMKRKKTGIIWLIFMIIWMSVIFSFSAKKAVESEGMSHSVGKEIGRLIVPQFTSWSEERQEQFAKIPGTQMCACNRVRGPWCADTEDGVFFFGRQRETVHADLLVCRYSICGK